MNIHAVKAIYIFEMSRTFRTLLQSIASPVISTSLYFIVFGSAIGAHMNQIDNVSYGAFIVPGLIMLAILTESISNASFGIYMPKFIGTIYEVLSAPVSVVEIVIGYVGAAASKSIMLGLIILITARLFVDFSIAHPVWMVAFLVLTSVTFSLFGFIIGVWADGWEKLQIVPTLVITPLTFLERAAAVFPDHVAIIHGDRRWSYLDFYTRAKKLASALARRGIKRGDTVSAVLANTPQMLEAHYGVPMTQGVLNTLNTRLDPAIIAFSLDHAETKVLITDREFSKTV